MVNFVQILAKSMFYILFFPDSFIFTYMTRVFNHYNTSFARLHFLLCQVYLHINAHRGCKRRFRGCRNDVISWSDIPDLARVFLDGPVRREFPGSGNVEQTHSRPSEWVAVNLIHSRLAVHIFLKVGHYQVAENHSVNIYNWRF